MAHRFRFFVDAAGEPGAHVQLEEADTKHLRVLRARPGDEVEAVDNAGCVWDATVAEGGSLLLVALREQPTVLPRIELLAGVLTGQRWDTLVDNAVQAGVWRIVPVVARAAEATKVATRLERSRRVARAAAAQSKRTLVPQVAEPVALEQLVAAQPGIVLVAAEAPPLPDVVRAGTDEDADAGAAVTGGVAARLLVGPAEGLETELVARLADAGWRRASLGPTVLRSELAAAVAVASALQALR